VSRQRCVDHSNQWMRHSAAAGTYRAPHQLPSANHNLLWTEVLVGRATWVPKAGPALPRAGEGMATRGSPDRSGPSPAPFDVPDRVASSPATASTARAGPRTAACRHLLGFMVGTWWRRGRTSGQQTRREPATVAPSSPDARAGPPIGGPASSRGRCAAPGDRRGVAQRAEPLPKVQSVNPMFFPSPTGAATGYLVP
jgi:hypothetical protein